MFKEIIMEFAKPMFVSIFALSSIAHADLPDDYQSRTAEEKCQILLNHTQSDRYSSLPNANAGVLDMLNLFRPTYLIQSFTETGDEIPVGRQKLIHRYGSTAQVEFRVTKPSRYTGLFQTGAMGLARISIANGDLSNFTPGMGLKLLVSGKESVNFQVMYSLDGQGADTNPMRNSFSNAIPAPTRLNFLTRRLLTAFHNTVLLLRSTFGSRIRNENTLPIDGASLVNADGTSVTQSVSPYQIIFEPNPFIKKRIDDWIVQNPEGDFRHALENGVLPNEVLYTVLVRATETSPLEELGELVTRSQFFTGEYQDSKLFFSHLHQTRF